MLGTAEPPGPWCPSQVDVRDHGLGSACGFLCSALAQPRSIPRMVACLPPGGGLRPAPWCGLWMLLHGRGDLGWGDAHSRVPGLPARARFPGGHPEQGEPHWRLGSLQVLMSSPYEGEGRGIAMLNLLRTLSHSIAPSMADMWELEIPLLVKYLEGEELEGPTLSRPPSLCAGWATTIHVARLRVG